MYLSHMKTGYVYIITNINHEVLYIGVTSDLPKRIWEHKNKVVDGFSKRYCLSKLVYYEVFGTIEDAIYREKCMKKWNRAWKVRLIEAMNINWNDLYDKII